MLLTTPKKKPPKKRACGASYYTILSTACYPHLAIISFKDNAYLPGKDSMFPLFDPREDYETHLSKLPKRAQKIREEFKKKAPIPRPLPHTWSHIFDIPVASSIGLSACPISLGEGARVSAEIGFDILIYKTIRSHPYKGHPPPTMLPLAFTKDEALALKPQSLTTSEIWPDLSSLNERHQARAANSLGIPCLSLEWAMEDIEKTRQTLSPGQLLMVSVWGQEQRSNGIARDLIQDFIYTARSAQEAGAHAIELNLSCPNISTDSEPLYKDICTLELLLIPILKALRNIPVTVKLGLCQGEHLRSVMQAIARVGLRGICGLNGLPHMVRTPEGAPAFNAAERLMASVTGEPLRSLALNFAQ